MFCAVCAFVVGGYTLTFQERHIIQYVRGCVRCVAATRCGIILTDGRLETGVPACGAKRVYIPRGVLRGIKLDVFLWVLRVEGWRLEPWRAWAWR